MKKIWKSYLAYLIMGGSFMLLFVINFKWPNHWLDSDMAAEMISSKLFAEEGSFLFSKNWCYSTEFRMLYTQLFMSPLFTFITSWKVIRLITNIICYILMIASYFFMLSKFKVSSFLKVMSAVILLLPFSETMMTHMQMGNTYMMHVILIFTAMGLFMQLVDWNENSKKRNAIFLLLYILLMILCGVTGIRYFLALMLPLLLATILLVLRQPQWQVLRREISKTNWIALFKTKAFGYVIIALEGAAAMLAGYGINLLYISRQYSFQTYESINFISIYQGILGQRLEDSFGSLMMLLGYIPDRAVLSLRGIATMAAFLLLGIFIYITMKCIKTCVLEYRFFVMLFLSAMVINTLIFVFTNSTLVPRYYITVFIFVLPVLIIYFQEEKRPLDKILVAALLVAALALGTGKTVVSYITNDKNENRYGAVAFLQEEGYEFGYATYWNGNITTELSNGDIEVANIGDPEYMDFFEWSSKKEYYENNDYQGKVFLLLTVEQAVTHEDTTALQNGNLVYEDSWYKVYTYDSIEAFLSYKEVRE